MNKNVKGVIICLVIILLFGVSIFFGYNYFKLKNNESNQNNSNNQNNNVKENNAKNELSEEAKREILRILDLTETGFKKLTAQEKIDAELTETGDYIDVSSSAFTLFLSLDSGKNRNIDSMSDYAILHLIYNYALKNNMTTTISGSEVSSCDAGAGYCDAITKEVYDKIAKKYGIKTSADSLFDSEDKYKNYYLFLFGGVSSMYEKVSDKLTFDLKNDDILVTYTIKSDEGTDVKIVFTFKSNNKDVYLYSFDVENNTISNSLE